MLNFDKMSIFQLKTFNSIPSKIHYDFNKLTEDILKSTSFKVADLFSLAVSRHPYQSPFFDICIKLEMASLYLAEGISFKKIITSDLELYKILNKSNLDCKLEFKETKNIDYFFGSVFHIIKRISRILLITFNELLSRDKSRISKLLSLSSVTLIDTFMLPNSISSKRYLDRYYNGLFTYLDDNTKKNTFYLPHINANYSRSDLKKVYINSDENIVFKHDFLKVSDYIQAIFLLSKHKVHNNSKFYFKNFNITNFIKKNIKNEKFNSSSFWALLNYFFIKRLKQNKIKLESFINWNENQPIDKGLVRGIHDFYPKIVVKGYRAFIVSTDYNLYLMPTQFEVDNKVIPDEIIVTGSGLVDQVRGFCENIKVSVGPAFRFQDINKPTRFLKNKKSILVALPIGFDDSVNIINSLIEIQKYIKFDYYKFIIRPHPTNSIESLQLRIRDIGKINYCWSKGDFRDNVLDSFLLISNTSSTLLESLAYGVSVIIVGSNKSITQNPIPKTIDKRLWSIVYNAKDLANKIIFFHNFSESNQQDIIKSSALIKKEFFGQITKNHVNKLLNI